MSMWQIAVWLVTSLGVAGTIAVFVLYPTIAAAIGRGLISLFNLVLGYRLGCAIVAAIVVGLAVDYWRHDRDDKAYAAKTAEFEQAQKARDAKIEADTKLWVSKRIADDYMAEQEGKVDVANFEKSLPADLKCPVGDRAGELRSIAGEAVRQPAKRVRQPARPSAAATDRRKFRLPNLITRGFSRVEGRQSTHSNAQGL